MNQFFCPLFVPPRLNLLSSPEVRQPGKAPNYSVNWTSGKTEGGPGPEVVDAMKGREQVRRIKMLPSYSGKERQLLDYFTVSPFAQERGLPSRLAKASFFRRWLLLVHSGGLSSLTGVEERLRGGKADADLRQYSEAKRAAEDFQVQEDSFPLKSIEILKEYFSHRVPRIGCSLRSARLTWATGSRSRWSRTSSTWTTSFEEE